MLNGGTKITIENVAGLLHQTQTPNLELAETQLMLFKQDPCYLICLMEILADDKYKPIEIVAALEFKNTIKMHWVTLFCNL